MTAIVGRTMESTSLLADPVAGNSDSSTVPPMDLSQAVGI